MRFVHTLEDLDWNNRPYPLKVEIKNREISYLDRYPYHAFYRPLGSCSYSLESLKGSFFTVGRGEVEDHLSDNPGLYYVISITETTIDSYCIGFIKNMKLTLSDITGPYTSELEDFYHTRSSLVFFSLKDLEQFDGSKN